MGAIGGLFGLGGGAAGTGFAPPQLANIQTGVETGQAVQAYDQNQGALAQQQALLNALQGQGGVGNQNRVYDQLQGVINGTGPNPAQAMLNQETAKNIAAQGALMAGQRGAGANVGLMARQAAMQGANLQQQAVGQGATMQANQSLNALGQAGQLANTQAGNLINATQGYTGAQQAEQGNLLNAIAQQNQARVSSQGNVNSANASLTGTRMGQQPDTIGSALNAVFTAASGAPGGKAYGGEIGGYADGGDVQSSFGRFVSTVGAPSAQPMEMVPYPSGENKKSESLKKAFSSVGNAGASILGGSSQGAGAAPTTMGGKMGGGIPQSHGGMVPVILSPKEKVISPEKVGEAAGGKIDAKTVPGKASVAGDSYKNDTVKTSLPEGSIVIPRSKAGNEKDAASFVRSVLAKRGRK